MPHVTQILEDLRKKYFELRGLEERSDNMLKEVIETYYIVEGLNRLQTDLDCLDLLIKNKTLKERAVELGFEDVNENAKGSQTGKRRTKLRRFYNRSREAVASLHIVKQISKKVNRDTDITYVKLKRITRLQRTKIAELMRIVRGTIVTNYGILEQLQVLSEMHSNTASLWDKLRCLTHPEDTTDPRTEERRGSFKEKIDTESVLETEHKIRNTEYVEEYSITGSNESINTLTYSYEPTPCQTELLHKHGKNLVKSKRILFSNRPFTEVPIGDGRFQENASNQCPEPLSEEKSVEDRKNSPDTSDVGNLESANARAELKCDSVST